MEFKDWFRLQEDGDLNAFGTMGDTDDASFRRQTVDPKSNIEFDKSINLKRKLKKLNFCKKQRKQ